MLKALMVFIALWTSAAHAAEVKITGRLGYISEWEIVATARATETGQRPEFVGPLVIKHVGACSPNGSVEKSGEIRFRRTASSVEGVFTLAGEQCAFEAHNATDEGVMTCPNKGGVPLSLKID